VISPRAASCWLMLEPLRTPKQNSPFFRGCALRRQDCVLRRDRQPSTYCQRLQAALKHHAIFPMLRYSRQSICLQCRRDIFTGTKRFESAAMRQHHRGTVEGSLVEHDVPFAHKTSSHTCAQVLNFVID
jgi:hypothetical protein